MDIEQVVNRSFLSRVPEIMAAQPELTIEQAIKVALDTDEAFCIRMQLANDRERHGLDKGAEEAIRIMAERVYQRLREASSMSNPTRNSMTFCNQRAGGVIVLLLTLISN